MFCSHSIGTGSWGLDVLPSEFIVPILIFLYSNVPELLRPNKAIHRPEEGTMMSTVLVDKQNSQTRAGEIVQLVKCLSWKHEDLSLILRTCEKIIKMKIKTKRRKVWWGTVLL